MDVASMQLLLAPRTGRDVTSAVRLGNGMPALVTG